MNERIKELKKQAWDYAMAVHDGQLVPSPDKAVWPMDEVFDEKFAELIVRECITNIAHDTANWSGDEGTMAYYQGVQDAVKSIKQHFGVEE